MPLTTSSRKYSISFSSMWELHKADNQDCPLLLSKILKLSGQIRYGKNHVLEAWKTKYLLVVVFSRAQLFMTPWTVALLGSSMGFSRQEYWSRLPCPPPGDLPNPGSKLRLLLGRQILDHWATREAHEYLWESLKKEVWRRRWLNSILGAGISPGRE